MSDSDFECGYESVSVSVCVSVRIGLSASVRVGESIIISISISISISVRASVSCMCECGHDRKCECEIIKKIKIIVSTFSKITHFSNLRFSPKISIDGNTDSNAVPKPYIADSKDTPVKDPLEYFFAHKVWTLDLYLELPDNENNIQISIIEVEFFSVKLSMYVQYELNNKIREVKVVFIIPTRSA